MSPLPFLVTALLTVAVRLVYLLESDNPFWSSLGLDLEIYHAWAQDIVANPLLGSDPFTQAPFFPVTLAAAYGLIGPDPVKALFFHLIPALIGVLATVWVAYRWKGTAAAWIAGLLFALYKPAIFYTGVLLPPTWVLALSSLLLAAGWWLLYEKDARSETKDTIGRVAVGVLLGILTLAQPVCLLLVLPLIAFGSVDQPSRLYKAPTVAPADARRSWSRTGFLLLGLVLPLGISLIHNSTHGGPALISHNGGINLYIGNGPEANGAYVRPAGMEENRDLLGVTLAARRLALRDANLVAVGDQSGPQAVGLQEADRYWYETAVSAMAQNPGRTLGLFVRKLGFFFMQYEIPQVESLRYESRFSRILSLPLPGMAFLLSAAIFGAVLLFRKDPRSRWIVASILVLALGVSVFFVTARFRVPVVPWLIVLGSAGIGSLLATAKEPSKKPAKGAVMKSGAKPGTKPDANSDMKSGTKSDMKPDLKPGRKHLTLAAVSGLVAGAVSLGLSAGINAAASDGQHVFRLGVVAEREGRTGIAIERYKEALQLNDELAKAHVNLGTLLARGQQFEEARPHLERGVALDGTSGIAQQNLGQLYQTLGRKEDAIVRFEQAIAMEPELVSARESAAYLLYEMGRVPEAVGHLAEVLKRAPKGSPPEIRANTLYSLSAERQQRLEEFAEQGAEEDWSKSPKLLQADVFMAQQRFDAAARLYRDATMTPEFRPYAHAVLEQMEASGLAPRSTLK